MQYHMDNPFPATVGRVCHVTDTELRVVRDSLRWIGASVTEREIGRFKIADMPPGVSGSYWHAMRVIELAPSAEHSTLLHELAHSQQTDVGLPVAYKNPDGSTDWAAYDSCPLEVEARAVERLAYIMIRPDWSIIREIAEYAADQATNSAGHLDRLLWAEWIISNNNLQRPKPRHLGRRARLTINGMVRNFNKGVINQ